jgi:hypothetical protein
MEINFGGSRLTRNDEIMPKKVIARAKGASIERSNSTDL